MEDETAECLVVARALATLRKKDARWESNLITFLNMSTILQIKWWRHVQRQVNLGLNSMQPLVLEVIKQKMIE